MNQLVQYTTRSVSLILTVLAALTLAACGNSGGSSSGGGGNGGGPLSGRYVAFYSDASNLVAGDTNAVRDVFVHDTQTGITTRVSLDSTGAEGNGDSYAPALR